MAIDNGNMNPAARNIIREGYVVATYPERNTCRVCFPDKDNLVSAELQVITPFAGGNKCYSMPDINEVVVCCFSGNADDGTGYILGSVFSAKNMPNADSADVTRIDFSDGTSISYNRATHKMDINSAGDITINARGNIKMTARRIDLN